MATDVGLTDGQAANAAILNRVMFAGAGKLQCKELWARVRYTGSAWEVSSTIDSAQLVSANVTFSTDHINIALSGFTAAPEVQLTGVYVAAGPRVPMVGTITSTQAQVYFLDYAGAVDSTQSTKMDCMIHLTGV